jgi:peptidoglycan/LPS O-acetylase OafA/YrhL
MTAAAVRAGTTNKLGHRPGLDAVRGAAALAVVVAHSGVGPTRAAAVAVTVFFVLSGFLITSGLLEQRDRGGVRFARFYERRARRLLPALVPVLVAGTVVNMIWWPEVNDAATFAAGLGFQLNWWDAAGQPVGVFGGLWSLAVEEHFYLAWPLLVALVPAARLPVVLTAAVGGSLAAGWILPISDDVMYRATPFRVGELAMGALCAVGFRRGLPRLPWTAAALAVVGLGWVSQRPASADYVPVSPAVGGVCAAVVVLWMVNAQGWRPLNWSGQLSYGIYLWHAPVYMVALELGLASWGLLAVSLPVTVGIAWCSHRWVEARWLGDRDPVVGRHPRLQSFPVGRVERGVADHAVREPTIEEQRGSRAEQRTEYEVVSVPGVTEPVAVVGPEIGGKRR